MDVQQLINNTANYDSAYIDLTLLFVVFVLVVLVVNVLAMMVEGVLSIYIWVGKYLERKTKPRLSIPLIFKKA